MEFGEDEGNTLETPSDDEEITIPSQEREDLRKVDIRREQLENTQREDVATTYGAQAWGSPATDGCGAPATEDSVFREATQLPSAVRHRNGNLRLSLGRRIDMEEEVFTPPRGEGGVWPLSLRVCKRRHELCLRFFWRTLHEMVVKIRRMSDRQWRR